MRLAANQAENVRVHKHAGLVDTRFTFPVVVGDGTEHLDGYLSPVPRGPPNFTKTAFVCVGGGGGGGRGDYYYVVKGL